DVADALVSKAIRDSLQAFRELIRIRSKGAVGAELIRCATNCGCRLLGLCCGGFLALLEFLAAPLLRLLDGLRGLSLKLFPRIRRTAPGFTPAIPAAGSIRRRH